MMVATTTSKAGHFQGTDGTTKQTAEKPSVCNQGTPSHAAETPSVLYQGTPSGVPQTGPGKSALAAEEARLSVWTLANFPQYRRD